MKNKKLFIILAMAAVFIGVIASNIYLNSKKHDPNISLIGPKENVPADAPTEGRFNTFSIPIPGVLSRSGQPSIDDFRWLKNNGWKSIIDLREDNERGDVSLDSKIPGFNELGFIFISIPIKDGDTPSQEQAVQFLEFAADSKNQPVHIHCHAGTGRAGLITALYRYAVQGWPMDRAIEEKAAFGSNNKVQKKWLLKWANSHRAGEYAK